VPSYIGSQSKFFKKQKKKFTIRLFVSFFINQKISLSIYRSLSVCCFNFIFWIWADFSRIFLRKVLILFENNRKFGKKFRKRRFLYITKACFSKNTKIANVEIDITLFVPRTPIYRNKMNILQIDVIMIKWLERSSPSF